MRRFIACLLFVLVLDSAPSLRAEAPSRRYINPNGRLTLGMEQLLTSNVSIGDVDGDGDPDIVVANGRHWSQPNEIYFLGQGGYKYSTRLGKYASSSYSADLVDLDADGDLDILEANDMAPNRVYQNDGKGSFSEWGTYGAAEAPSRGQLIADFDGDGDPDVLLLNRGSANERCLNDGKGRFSSCVAVGDDDEPSLSAVAIDLDADGDLDLVVAQRERRANRTFINDGNAGFSVGDELPGRRDTRAIASGDLNGDGIADIVTGNLDGPNGVSFGSESGFKERVEFGEPEEATSDLALADLDQDGDLDIVSAHAGAPSVAFFNDGTGRKFERVVLIDEPFDTYAVAVSPLNSDPFPDIVFANSGELNFVLVSIPAEQE